MKNECQTRVPATVASTVLLGLYGLMSAPLQAQPLSVPALPSGCVYTENRVQPLQGMVKISAAIPLFTPVDDVPKTVLSLSVRCDGSQDTDVSIGLTPAASMEWAGPDQDILATNVPGIGIRLVTESESTGSACGSQGVFSGKYVRQCRLSRSDNDERQMTFTVKAQIVKTGNNTPLQMHKPLQAASGSLLLTVQGDGQQATDLFNLGVFTPSVVTEASCTLVTDQTQTVTFGEVYRPKRSSPEQTLGEVRSTPIEVACYPQRDTDSNDYNVSVIFSAGEPYKGSDNALATTVDDLAIRFSDKPDGSRWLRFGDSLPMTYKAENGGKSYFSQAWYWFLRYMPEGDHQQVGELNAVATYTITIQ